MMKTLMLTGLGLACWATATQAEPLSCLIEPDRVADVGAASVGVIDEVRVERGDGVAALQQRRGQGLDVVFLDPPFGDDGNPALFNAALLAARQALGEQGLIYLEAPRAWTADELAQLGLQLHRQGKAGVVHFHLLQPLPPQ